MTAAELDRTYCQWTYLLHVWVLQHLGRYISARYYPSPTWEMELFAGIPQQAAGSVPKLEPPDGAEVSTFKLPRPEHHPTQEDVDTAFAGLCLAAALILKVDLGKRKLANGCPPPSLTALNPPHEP